MFSSLSSKLTCSIFVQTEGGDHERLFFGSLFFTEPRRMSHPVRVQPAQRFGFLDEKERDSNFQNAAGPESLKRWEGGKRWRDGGRLPSSRLTQQTSGLLLLLLLCLDSPTLFFFLVFYAEVEGREKGTTAEHGVEKGGWEKGRNVKMKVKNWQRVQESIKNNLSVPGGSHSR